MGRKWKKINIQGELSMKKKIFILLAIFIFLINLPSVLAHCPLCTAAAGTGVLFTRAYGVDDTIAGLFLGAAIISSALWFNKWLKKRINFKFQETLMVIISFLLFAIPFYTTGLITDSTMVKLMPDHHSIFGLGVFGIDKLLFGMIIGSLAVWGAFVLNEAIKKAKGRVLYPYQGMSFMLIVLAVLSLLFWIITK